jgi:GntR family transcriptional regulator / MocR family aminotransferase
MKNSGSGALFPCVPFERNSSVPFYKQIFEGYRQAILSGLLRPGQRLPSTRALAMELGISRLPAVIAFDQLLHEGYVEGKVGEGTYVKESIPEEFGASFSVRKRLVPIERNSAPSADRVIGPFRVSLPALDQFPRKIWSRLVSRYARNLPLDLMAYGDPAGYYPLRDAIAQYLQTARAVHCEPDQVLIVPGSQMALQVCARAILRPGDSVCMEEPGYPGAREALKSSGLTTIPVSLDEEGINIHQLHALGKKIRAVYVTPSHQYPLGASMTASRRLELLDWAERNQSWIIEDDYDSEFRYASRPLGSLQGMDTASRVIYIGTFSKVLFPSLRIGYMVIPVALWNSFVSMRETLDIFSPTLYQLVLTDFLQEGHFARHLRRMRRIYLSRRNALVESLHEYAGKTLKPYNTDAGLHLCVFLPRGLKDSDVVRRCLQHGISATALSACYAGRAPKNGLILGFGGADEQQINVATRTLSRVIRER